MIGLRKFRLVLADARGGGTRDESLRESAWEANTTVHNEKFILKDYYEFLKYFAIILLA